MRWQAPWSPELRALVRPYRTVAEVLAQREVGPLAAALRRPLLLLAVLAVFVSFTAAGKLVLVHVLWATVSYTFLVTLQGVGLAATVALFARGRLRELPYVVDAGALARAPWLVFLAAFTVWHALFADAGASLFAVFLDVRMMAVIVACMVWSRVIDHALWRALGLSRARALAAVLVHDVAVLGPGIVWYLATGQLVPLLAGAPS